MFITKDVKKAWEKQWKKYNEKPHLILPKQRFIFEPNEEEKLHYNVTILNYVSRKCLHCDLLAFCMKDYILNIGSMPCDTFTYWRFLQTDSWNKSHKYNPALYESGLIDKIDKEKWLEEERHLLFW